jgi:hypothetical protein
VSNILMRFRWTIIVPTLGLVLFAAITFNALRWNRAFFATPSQHFWWSGTRLNKNPLNQHPKAPRSTPCGEGCASWDPEYIWVEPGILPRILVLSALPSFVIGLSIVRGLSHFGISELKSFMVTMPLLVMVWHGFVGWLFDRWRLKRRQHLPMKSISNR